MTAHAIASKFRRARVNAEHLAYLDRDTKGYFEAVDFLDKLAKALGNA